MSSYKVVSRNPLTGLQVKKRVYPSKESFDLYSDETIQRYNKHHIVEVFILDESDDGYYSKWVLVESRKSLCEKKCSMNCPCYRMDGTCNA